MKIAVDSAPLSSGHSVRGMGMYTRNLISALKAESKKHKNITIDSFEFSNERERLKRYDLIHYPYFDLFQASLPFSSPVAFVVTVPDVIPLIYPKYYPPGIRGRLKFGYQKIVLKKAAGVITISETSRKDIVRFLGVEDKKIYTTYLAPNFRVKESTNTQKAAVKKKYGLPSTFVLYVGDVNWNKNVVRLIEAVKLAGVKLVIVGKQAVSKSYAKDHIENEPLNQIINKYGGDKDIMRLGYLDDDDLNIVWQLATLYCQPSLYEGFGLPVLEAFDAGVAVLASKTQAIVEVGDDACEYFDPYRVDELSKKINELLGSKSRREVLVREGRDRLGEFSWDKTARETLRAYKASLEV